MADNNIPFAQFRTKPLRDVPELSPDNLSDNDQIVVVDKGGKNPPTRLLRISILRDFLDLVDILRKSDLAKPLGIATLDSSARLNKDQVPSNVVLIDKLNEYIKAIEKGSPNGIATLDFNRLVPNSQLPADIIRQFEFLGHTLSNSNPHNVTALQINAEPAFTTLAPSKGGLGTTQLLGLVKGTVDGYVPAIEGVDYLAVDSVISGGTY